VGGIPTQRDLASSLSRSVGTINKTVGELTAAGFMDPTGLSADGLEALEPYRVQRAVFVAAGFGSRLVPITLNTPKPLIRVGGVRIIDTLLDAVKAAGIDEVHIVRGYLAEQFDQLLYKYPNIKFIDNPVYNESNNISSAYCARELLGSAYLLESDLLLRNPKLITKYQYTSNYLCTPVEHTDDWCFFTNGTRIVRMAIGGENCYQMCGISYWTKRDGAQLCEHIKQIYDSPGGKERYWDQVPMEYFLHDYRVEVRPCTSGDIVEIDTYRELKAVDSVYE
jgi:CTP:phosphocholine cytidylyltransferase-like protein